VFIYYDKLIILSEWNKNKNIAKTICNIFLPEILIAFLIVLIEVIIKFYTFLKIN
jgi:hypothetical protein